MENENKVSSISKARSYEEMAEFWSTHSTADYEDQTHEVDVTFHEQAFSAGGEGMNQTEQLLEQPGTATKPAELDWSLGWRYEISYQPNGEQTATRIPLTPEEARHPKEGYVMPERTEHDIISATNLTSSSVNTNC